jgi:hypothetical protein
MTSTVGMIMMVRDEAEVIGANLRFHARLGVDEFVIMDNASRDGTREALERLATDLPITIVDQRDTDFRQEAWGTQLAHRLQDMGLDWGLMLDADEFVAAERTPLKETLAGLAHPIRCPRQNVLPLDVDLCRLNGNPLAPARFRVTKPLGKMRRQLDEHPDVPVMLGRVAGKVLFPLKGLSRIFHGNHAVEHATKTENSSEFLIRHYPVRSLEGFLRKLDHAAERFRQEREVLPGRSWHLRRWVRLREQGAIEDEYRRLGMPASRLTGYLREGTVVEDRFSEQLD